MVKKPRKPTEMQKRVALKLIENAKLPRPRSGGEILEESGYGPGMVKNPQLILESPGVKQALEDFGFTEVNAKKVVAKILLNEDEDAVARLKASDQIFKVHGSYAPDKSVNVNLNVETESPRIKELTEKLNELHGG